MGCNVCEGNDKEHCEYCGVKPTRNINSIIGAMEVETKRYDREWAHINADNLLIEALRLHPSDNIELLITTYHNVPKWYA